MRNLSIVVVLVSGLLFASGCRDGKKPTGDMAGPAVKQPTHETPPTHGQTPKAPPPANKPAIPPAENARVTFALASKGLSKDLSWKCDPIFADVNKDGFLDLAAHPRLGKGPRVWFGNGLGAWADASSGLEFGTNSCGGGLSFGDINKDGHLDLAVGDHCQGVYVYLGDSQGHWQMVTKALFALGHVAPGGAVEEYTGAEDMDMGDVNGDGFLDIVTIASDNGGYAIYLGDGSGSNWEQWDSSDLPGQGWGTRVVLADMNKDGSLDVLSSNSVGPRVWLNDGKARFTPASEGLPSPMFQGLYMGITSGDVNEDGRPDIAVGNWVDGPEIYFQQPNGSWKKSAPVFPDMMGGSYGIALGDLDQDGHLDVISAGRFQKTPGLVRGVFALMGDGRGGWTHAENTGLPNTGMLFNWGVGLADVNNDRVPDVAVGSGGLVETAPGPTEPVIPERLLVWFTRPAKQGK